MPLSPSRARRSLLVAASGAAVVLSGLAAPAVAGTPDRPMQLSNAVTADAIFGHLGALDRIGTRNAGTRASGTPGYAKSVDYLMRTLRTAGYRPTKQQFDFPFFRELAPAELHRVSPDPKSYPAADVATMTFSPSGDVTGKVIPVDTTFTPTDTSTSGCEPADFSGLGFTPDGLEVALIQRGTCTFFAKAQNAQAAGADAVVIFNRGTPNNTAAVAGTLGGLGIDVPTVGASFASGAELGSTADTVARVVTSTESETRQTWNVFAETRTGNPDDVVMAGAHLDSVVPGPGINDNGSGSSTILAIAQQMAKPKFAPKNKVRFAWWGAEELGLLGSEHYVDTLPVAERDKIALYLNFDMVGSPNYVRFVYDGDNSAFPPGPGAAEGPAGSGAIEALFHSYFDRVGMESAETPFSGRSDYGPFIAVGIPAGGLFTGAEGTKTAAEAAVYGGTAGDPYDKCYHQACDTIANVSHDAIDEMSGAAAYAIMTYALDSTLVDPAAAARSTGAAGGGGGLHDDAHASPAS